MKKEMEKGKINTSKKLLAKFAESFLLVFL